MGKHCDNKMDPGHVFNGSQIYCTRVFFFESIAVKSCLKPRDQKSHVFWTINAKSNAWFFFLLLSQLRSSVRSYCSRSGYLIYYVINLRFHSGRFLGRFLGNNWIRNIQSSMRFHKSYDLLSKFKWYKTQNIHMFHTKKKTFVK